MDSPGRLEDTVVEQSLGIAGIRNMRMYTEQCHSSIDTWAYAVYVVTTESEEGIGNYASTSYSISECYLAKKSTPMD